MDLTKIAERLDADERLKLKYKCFLRLSDDESHRQVTRVDKLLDVEPENDVLFVSFGDTDVIWVRKQEAIEVMPDDGVYGETAGY